MTDSKYISIKGARVNNLKNIDVNIPRNKLVVITGLSGSGKSTIAVELEKMLNDAKLNTKVTAELKKRRTDNIRTLKSFGLEI